MSVVEAAELCRYEILTNERESDVLVARKTLVGWVGQRQDPISIIVAAWQPPATASLFITF